MSKFKPAYEAVNFRIDKSARLALVEIAKSKNISLSQLVRDIFNDYLKTAKKN